MKFHTMNDFNIFMNWLSGNYFPLTEEDEGLGIGDTIYAIFTWIIFLMGLFSVVIGLICYIPALETLQKGGPTFITSFEVFTLLGYLSTQRKPLRKLIRQVNGILIESEDLERCIRIMVDPHKGRLKLYTVLATASVVFFAGIPVFSVLKTDRFVWSDYALPSYVPGSPNSAPVFVLGVFVQTVGCSYMMLKKIGIDVYMSSLITLLAGEYRYVQERMTAAFKEKDDASVVEALKECIQHHCNTMETGESLVDILSVNVGLTYLNSIARFCFAAFTVITSETYVGKIMTAMFGVGSLMQVFMLCSCIQTLLEASTEVDDGAFYENWYERGPMVKSIFRIAGKGSQMECRLTAFRVVDLTVPTFATILNKAYSVCLFLMTF